jgi:hypothetical protein
MRSISGIRMTVSGTSLSRAGCIGEAAIRRKVYSGEAERFAGGFIRPPRAEAQWQEMPMRLNSTQVKQTMSQIDAQVLPDDHPAVTQLNTLFGDHTFFLDGEGLKVLEPAEVPETAAQAGEIVSLANWSDASLTSLRPHEPEPTGVLIVLESRH